MPVNMVTPVTAETFKRLNFNAGILLHDFEFGTATDAASLMALIVDPETQQNCWFGATKGGINVQENKKYWSATMDGLRMPFVGDKQVDSAQPKITGTLVEFTPANLKALSGAADIENGTGSNVKIVQPRLSINPDDYFSNVVFVANNGADGLYVAELKNALSTTGVNSQSTDKDIGTLPFEFVGHSDSPVYTDDLPLTYYFFAAATD